MLTFYMWSVCYRFRLWNIYSGTSLFSRQFDFFVFFCLEQQISLSACCPFMFTQCVSITLPLANKKTPSFLNNLGNLRGACGDLCYFFFFFFKRFLFSYVCHVSRSTWAAVRRSAGGGVWSGSGSLWPVGRHPLRLPAWLTSPRLLLAVILNCRRVLFPGAPRV